jgi:hypothetical protein
MARMLMGRHLGGSSLETAMRLLQRLQLRFGQQHAILRHLGLERLRPLAGGLQVVALPDAAHACGRDRHPLPFQRLRHPQLAPGRLLDGEHYDRLLDLDWGAVLQHRLAAADLLQRELAAFVVELLEPIKAVPGIAHHLAGLRHVAELLGRCRTLPRSL